MLLKEPPEPIKISLLQDYVEWGRLVPWEKLNKKFTMSLQDQPKLSTYANLFGDFDFNNSPLAPQESKLMCHLKLNQRSSSNFNSEQSWYIRPVMDHYYCFKV